MDYGGSVMDPNEQRKKALVDSLAGGTAATTPAPAPGNIAGTVAPPLVTDAAAPNPALGPAAAPPAAAGGLGSYANRLEGFDAGKLADTTHNSPKYQLGRALSQFDPRQGVTPDVLASLNKLGLGTFSGSGDKVSIAGGDPRWDGVNSIDLVRGFHDPNGTGGWQYGAEGPAPAGGAPAGGQKAPAGFGGAPLNSALTGDPMAAIQAAIGQQAGGGDYLQSLLAKLRGGQQ